MAFGKTLLFLQQFLTPQIRLARSAARFGSQHDESDWRTLDRALLMFDEANDFVTAAWWEPGSPRMSAVCGVISNQQQLPSPYGNDLAQRAPVDQFACN